LLLISRLSLYVERDVLLGERREGGLGDQVFAALEYPARKATQKKGERFALGGAVIEGDLDHDGDPSACGEIVPMNHSRFPDLEPL
jgi:hypothetical protein